MPAIQKLAHYKFIITCSMLDWARNELEIAGLFEDDLYNGSLGPHILCLMESFCDEGHSGMSASIVTKILNDLMSYRPLTSLGNPTETGDYMVVCDEPSVWQSTRDPAVFSEDEGVSWYRLDDSGPYKIPLSEYERSRFGNVNDFPVRIQKLSERLSRISRKLSNK